jgi:hypothetical protein
MTQHRQFEIMCALAAVGQLSSSDLAGLSQHVEACADCQRRLSEFARVSAQALLLFGEKHSNSRRPPVGMTARFVTRARAEGIPLEKSAGSQPSAFLYSLGWRGNIAAVLLMLAVIAGISNRRNSSPFSASAIVAGANATGEGTLEPEAAQVRSSRLFKRSQVVRRARSHHPFDTSKGTADGVQPSELGFTSTLGLTPSSARYSANCDQAEANLYSSLFSKVTEAKEPRLFKAFVTSQQTRRVAPWLISLNSLPPLFVYATDRSSFSRSSQMGMSQPSVDLSKIRTGIFSEFSGSKRLPQYQDVPEQRWPFSKEFKVGAR